MNCPICDKELTIDIRNKWILCSSNNHKFKVTDWDDATRKSVTLKQLSVTVMAIKNGLEENGDKVDDINKALLNGQMHAYQMLADYLRDDDFRDYEPEK